MSYDVRFRRHVLKVRAREGLSFVEAGKRFGLSKQTVYNWTKRLEEKKNRLRPAIKIDMDKLKEDIEAYPDAYYYERAKRLGVSTRCIGYALNRLGVTYKKNFQASQSQLRKAVYILPKNRSL